MGKIQDQLTAELLQALHAHAQLSTEVMALLSSQIVNDTLEVWSGTFGTDGVIARDYPVAAGSIYVRNVPAVLATPHDIVVSTGSPQSSTPSGLGTAIIPGNTTDTVPLASHTVTLYGTAGDKVWFAVFTAPVRPAS